MSDEVHRTEESGDFAARSARAMHTACDQARLDSRGATLIRLFASAVFHLPAGDAVARVVLHVDERALVRNTTAIQVTRWLSNLGFPTVRPLDVDQPIATDGCLVTLWRYLHQRPPSPGTADLGSLLKELHQLGPPPVPLPRYRPLISVRNAIAASTAISDEECQWLSAFSEELLDAYQSLDFALPEGMIHGDAYRGNLLRDGDGVVLADWDSVSIGPREIDLVPTLQASRFGLQPGDRQAFIMAYGRDISSWNGYDVLKTMREISTLTALLRNAPGDAASMKELRLRMVSLRTGDSRRWHTF